MITLRPRGDQQSAAQETRRYSRPFLVSVAIHAVVGLVIAQVLLIPTSFGRSVAKRRSDAIPAEQISFLSIPRSNTPDVRGRSGGDGNPVATRPRPDLVAPRTIPVGIPPVLRANTPAAPEGVGPLVGSGGAARGVRPSFNDPRVWRAPTRIVAAPKSAAQLMDSAIVAAITPFNDSMAAARPKRAAGDWTFGRNGRRWGIDQEAIRLGPISIPNAVLALLPINAQANPITGARNKQLNYMQSDIAFHAQRSIREDEFKRAVRNLRERKDRERAVKQRERQAAAAAPDGARAN